MKRFVASVKNVPGRLSLGETDITWVPEQGGNANIVIPYTSLAELRKNAVKSGDPDAKVILRITTGGGEAGAAPTNYSIRFTSPAAEKDREAVISELTPRMRENREKQAGTPPSGPATPGSSGGGKHPAAGAKRPRSDGGGATGGPSKAEMDFRKEIELRQAVLREDKDLKALWEKLVFKGRLVNEEDFWRTRQHILRDYAWKKSQTKGLQSEVLKGLRPQDDNSSNKYSLTPEIIETILNLYPSVRKAYEQHVPKGASEDVQRAFWSKYLESNHYRQTLSSSMVEPRAHDLFDAYMDEERDDFEPHPKRIKHSAHHPLLDLTTTTEDHIESGNRPDSTMRAGREKIPLRMIRVMNRYSQTALKEDRGETSVLTANEADETLLQVDIGQTLNFFGQLLISETGHVGNGTRGFAFAQ
ncbi:RNA polymerase II transcription factor B subunit 1 [Borealophlyctis nickersoniae]|nr:RNA polymerase II transcription factor B subunit 1 [Borealophlyctis nickersoniae]